MKWVFENWEWIMLAFMLIEKIIRLTPTKQDDVIFDMILIPLKDEFVKRFMTKGQKDEKPGKVR